MPNHKELLKKLGFLPKDNALDIFIKKYNDGYFLEVDFNKQTFYFGGKIKIQGKNYQNITKPEDWVVLECVNRLLETGYKSENISLEKVYPSGHGTSGRLDICVNRTDGSEYLLIECKTYGKEFDKEFTRIKKDGGQLFTYFKFSNKADLIMLYASQLDNNEIIYRNEIIKIENEYRIGDVKDFYNSWNKITKQQGVWENPPYDFKSRIFTKKDLVELSETESKRIFHEFASILRKHSVSDKPNAFNKIFNLFLAKLYDEAKRENDELEFCWRENDNAVDFQVRLINLHKDGLFAFLQKEIEGIDEKDFNSNLTPEELLEKKKKILKFNNILAIKEVLDDTSFEENQRVLKDVVQLLEKYKIRYPRKQQHLSDFFEKLLTTGLKQEVGQYFTPPPITKFIVRSLPIKEIIEREINKEAPELPAVIDYAAGSGHFITEAMEEYQDIINSFKDEDIKTFYPKSIKQIKSWQADPYEWAAKYVYGIEKDYRLVKVAKVGCYFYGDGVAQIIHGDGLDSFKTSKTYKGLLKENNNLEDSSKAKFSLVLSNPPYSVNDCKDDLEYIEAEKDFTLYPYLSNKSKEIECLFVERTKHLLKDDGIAAIILPNSILNNTGIQTKTREIILKFFDIIAITELGGNTFMATNTNTITLFLRRRNNQEFIKIENYISKFFISFTDNTINQIEKPISKYINYIWESISLEDYISLLKKSPNSTIKNHEIYKEYLKKIKTKKEDEFWNRLIEIEKDKLLYFIIAYKQKNIVIIKSGEKDLEKRFLGYYFSDRRGGEGMHSIQKGKTIDECTQLYNPNDSYDITKASSYIYNAFIGENVLQIDENLKENVSYVDLLDMITFDRADFEKSISLSANKKINFSEIWKTSKLENLDVIASIQKGTSITKDKTIEGDIPVIAGGQEPAYYHNKSNRNSNVVTVSASGAYAGFVNYFSTPIFASDCNTIISKKEEIISTKLIYIFLQSIQSEIYKLQRGQAQPHVYADDLSRVKIPIPSKEIQDKIIKEINTIEIKENKTKEEINKKRKIILDIFNQTELKTDKTIRLSDEDIFEVSIGKRVLKNEFVKNGKIPVYSANVIEPFGNIDKLLIEDFSKPSVLWGIDGDWMVNYIPKNYPFYPTDHCGVLRVKNNSVNEKYLAYALEKEGKIVEFSRIKRASIDRIQGIKIKAPSLHDQQKIATEIERTENQILKLNKELEEIKSKKLEVIKKYL